MITALRFQLIRAGHDLVFVSGGMLISAALTIATFGVLTLLGVVGPLVIAAMVLLLPPTLLLCGWAAQLTRSRVNFWAQDDGWRIPDAGYEPITSMETLGRAFADVRRWLDVLFEAVVAPIMRGCGAVMLVGWAALALFSTVSAVAALGSLGVAGTEPATLQVVRMLMGMDPSVQEAGGGWMVADLVVFTTMAVAFIVTAPLLLRVMALIEARVTLAALGDRRGAVPLEGWEEADGTRDRLGFSLHGWVVVQALLGATALVPILLLMFAVVSSWSSADSGAGTEVFGPVALTSIALLVAGPALMCASVAAVGWWPRITSATILFSAVLLLSIRFISGDALVALPTTLAATLAVSVFVYLQLFAGRQVLGLTVASALLGAIIVSEAAGVLLHTSLGWAVTIVLPILAASTLTTAGVAGYLLNQFLENRQALAAERRESLRVVQERDRSEQARTDLEERTRIARELHDVVAHSMSVISVQASTAQYRLPGEMAPEVVEEFDQIAATSRQALTEMRSLLAILRANPEPAAAGAAGAGAVGTAAPGAADDPRGGSETGGGGAGAVDGSALTAPQPDLTDLPQVIDGTRRAGVSVTEHWHGDWEQAPLELPPTLQLVVCRTVQEGLSNAMRHAPGAAVDVDLERSADAVTVRIRSGKAVDENAVAAPGAGLGIRGVRERVGALGGEVTAEPTEDGGFVLAVTVPANGPTAGRMPSR